MLALLGFDVISRDSTPRSAELVLTCFFMNNFLTVPINQVRTIPKVYNTKTPKGIQSRMMLDAMSQAHSMSLTVFSSTMPSMKAALVRFNNPRMMSASKEKERAEFDLLSLNGSILLCRTRKSAVENIIKVSLSTRFSTNV